MEKPKTNLKESETTEKSSNKRIEKEPIKAETVIYYDPTCSLNDSEDDEDDVIKNCDNEDFRQPVVDLRRKSFFINYL